MTDGQRRDDDGREPPESWPPAGTGAWVLASIAAWAAVLVVKLYPFAFASAAPGGLLTLLPRPTWVVAGQIVLFVPLAMIEAQAARRLLGGLGTLSLLLVSMDALLLSLVGETLQWWLPDRASSAIDLAANTLGGVLGYMIAMHAVDRR